MFLKPKLTIRKEKALVYKRYTDIEKSIALNSVYKTYDNIFWTFDYSTLTFSPIEQDFVKPNTRIINVSGTLRIKYLNNFYMYNSNIGWEKQSGTSYIFLSATFNNIGTYQTNKYYFSGSFDYVIKGAVEGTTTQFIKGNIMPLTSINIKYFDDTIDLQVDDLVVIGNKVYSVENPETSIKYQPKEYKVYFATLNSIL